MKKIFLLLVLFLIFGVTSAYAAAPVCTSFSFTASTVGASLIQYQCSDADGDALTFATVSGPSHGTITGLNTSTGYFVYTPTASYTGSDTITFNVTANSQTSSTATLSITVTNQKTRIVDTLTDPSGAARSGKVTFILTQKVTSPAGLIPVSSTVTGVLNGSGQFDVSVYPSASLSPSSYYQVWFESSIGQRELLGVYNIPATSSASITLAAHQVTNTNLSAQYTFLSQAALNSILSNAGVGSFEGRSGSVTSASGDYTATEITNTPAGTIAATNVQAALNELDSEKVASFEGRTGTVTSASGDYTATEITNTAAGTVAATNVQAAINELDTEKVASGSAASLNSVNASANASIAGPATTPTGGMRFTLYHAVGSDYEYMASGVESGAWWFNNITGGKYNFYFAGTKKFDFSASAFTPTTDNAFDFGGASNRFRHLYLSGGINLGSDATGDIYYRSSGGIFTRLGIGSSGNCLTVSSGLPAWGNCDGSDVVTLTGTQTLTNKTISDPSFTGLDSKFTVQDNSDATKQLRFQLSGITTGNLRTLTIPDASTTIVGDDTTQTLTNKTFTLPKITTHTPSSASDTCTTGTIVWDSSFVYVCVATDTWKRSALSTW